jgi:biopolymer transport protein ExbD
LESWDVFHGDRLELKRGLDAGAVRDAFSRGELRDDDLVRPAGTTIAWARLAEFPELIQALTPSPEPPPPAPPAAPASPPPATGRKQSAATEAYVPPNPSDYEVQSDDFGADLPLAPAATFRLSDERVPGVLSDVAFPVFNDEPDVPAPRAIHAKAHEPPRPGGQLWAEEVDEEEDDGDFDREVVNDGGDASDGLEILDDDEVDGSPAGSDDPEVDSRSSRIALPVVEARGWDDVPIEEGAEEEVDMSFTRSGPATVEELDLAPMVDVAFQLVLFFMVTATTVLYKTLEIPKPTKEQAPTAVTQGRSLSDLQDDFILVEIDATGGMKMDREPIAADMNTLVERLRTAREKTNRKSMLLSADYATKHRDTVVVIDAAHEIGMNIVIARPSNPVGPAPTLLSQPKAAAQPAAPAGSPPF